MTVTDAVACIPISASRLRAPSLRPETLNRERLGRTLDDATRRPLTVVCAPAGFGKTTAVAQWLAARERPHAWVALDAQDNDPQRLAVHLVTALDHALPGRLGRATTALQGGSDVQRTVLPLIADALAGDALDPRLDADATIDLDARIDRDPPWGDEGPFVIAFDDFHVVTRAESQRTVSALVDALPPGVAVIVTSRTSPPLRLARRRVASTVAEIGPSALRFSPDEADALLNGTLALDLAHDQLAQLDARFAGWGAGLALVATALRRGGRRQGVFTALTSTTVDVEQYLVEEVLQAVAPALRRFLRRTSILDRLNESLCVAVLDDPDAGEQFDAIRRDSLFVSTLDPAGSWLRYHDLFAETLRHDLERHEPSLLPELHARARRWFADGELLDEAIEHALRADDGPAAAALLVEHAPALLADRRHATVRSILDRLPADRGDHAPACDAIDVLCMISEGVDQRLTYERAAALVARSDGNEAVRRVLDRVLVSPFCGDVGRAVRLGREAWKRHADEPEAQTELAPQVGMALWLAGERVQARQLLEPRVRLPQPPASQIWILSTLAMLASEEDDVALADQHVREAITVVEDAGAQTAPELAGVHWVRGEVLRCAGRHDEAREQLARALEIEARRPGSLGHLIALVLDAQLALAEHDRTRARAQATRARSIAARHADVGTFADRLTAVETALRGRSEAAPLLGSAPTDGELRVLRRLDGDRTIAEIAGELFLSSNTVKSHVRRLYRRLGVGTREDAVAVARERGLLTAPDDA